MARPSSSSFWGLAFLTAGACHSGSAGPGDRSGWHDAAAEGPATPAAPGPWYWGNSTTTENQTVAHLGFDQGCARLGELKEEEGEVSFTAGFTLSRPPAERLKHYGGQADEQIDDGPLAGYGVAGTVLLVRAVREVFDQQGDSISTPLTPLQRLVSPPPPSAREASVSGKLKVGNPCSARNPLCRALIEPTFVVVWQDAGTGLRAYQFMRPSLTAPHVFEPGRYANCADPASRGYHQTLGVSWPLGQAFARRMDHAPEPERWTAWIDEVLPR